MPINKVLLLLKYGGEGHVKNKKEAYTEKGATIAAPFFLTV